MPRTSLTKTSSTGNAATAFQAVTMTAADVANGNQFSAEGNDLLVAQNTGASSHNISLSSVADLQGRTGNITNEAIAAGAIKIIGPLKTLGWCQSDGKIYCNADHAEVKFGIIKIK